ncbi:hypothetical protein PHAVU_009G257700 [Phaseolus vulgaris]|uniref:Uncharacterized protein n=1 Tax=Phaseolus vulgaris TaxID=3885 RepID=V7B2A3_PHAVU|nr:hypothetical protein PHAVU_009G257700g [Phaseolus vulgaris]ESW11008.1 hypothetical protein PHAVU_009G257700g [Phaseolus vulgaris]
MGNCAFKGITTTQPLSENDNIVKVLTPNGAIMELYTPITADCITKEFSGHGIFRSRRDFFSEPLHRDEELHAGDLYYLLPLDPSCRLPSTKNAARQLSDNAAASATLTPYRMCTYDNNNNRMWSETGEVCPRKGVWKVKLAISPEQLSEILSQESQTEAFVESLRMVAKCGGNGVLSAPNSDHSTSCD